MGKSKTFAEFKREVANGNIYMEIIERFGKTGDMIPERLKGVRKIDRVTSTAIVFINADGSESECSYTSTKLIDYDGEFLTVYNPGQREPTEEEREILSDVQKLEEDYYRANPYGEFFWERKDFFKRCSCPWMAGTDRVRGKRYMYNGKVLDNKIRGEMILRYKVVNPCVSNGD